MNERGSVIRPQRVSCVRVSLLIAHVGVGSLFLQRSDSKHFRLCGPAGNVVTTRFGAFSVKTAIADMQTKEQDCGSVKRYLQTQAESRIYPLAVVCRSLAKGLERTHPLLPWVRFSSLALRGRGAECLVLGLVSPFL